MKACKVYDLKSRQPISDKWNDLIQIEFELARLLRNVNVHNSKETISNVTENEWETQYTTLYDENLDEELATYVNAMFEAPNFKDRVQIGRYAWGKINPENIERKTRDYTKSELWALYHYDKEDGYAPLYYALVHRINDKKTVFLDAIWKSVYSELQKHWNSKTAPRMGIALASISIFGIGIKGDIVVFTSETVGSERMFRRAGIELLQKQNSPIEVSQAMTITDTNYWFYLSDLQSVYDSYTCLVCAKVSFLVCEHCMSAVYCSKECQSQDAKIHLLTDNLVHRSNGHPQ